MRARYYGFPAVVLLFGAASAVGDAVPSAPVDQDRETIERLESLRKKLPDIVSSWRKEPGVGSLKDSSYKSELRLLRRICPNRAKGVIVFESYDEEGKPKPNFSVHLTIFLAYQDGCWTTESFEVFGWSSADNFRTPYATLMLAIDEISKK